MTILNDYGGMGAAEAMELGVLNHELLELDMALGCQWFSKHGGLMEYDRWINMDNHMYSIYHGYIYIHIWMNHDDLAATPLKLMVDWVTVSERSCFRLANCCKLCRFWFVPSLVGTNSDSKGLKQNHSTFNDDSMDFTMFKCKHIIINCDQKVRIDPFPAN